jgi:hypothetical protein
MFADKHYLYGFTFFQKIVHYGPPYIFLFAILAGDRKYIRFPVHVGIDCSWITDDSLRWFVVEKLKLLFLVWSDILYSLVSNNRYLTLHAVFRECTARTSIVIFLRQMSSL